jgi:hypothetical protein
LNCNCKNANLFADPVLDKVADVLGNGLALPVVLDLVLGGALVLLHGGALLLLLDVALLFCYWRTLVLILEIKIQKIVLQNVQ